MSIEASQIKAALKTVQTEIILRESAGRGAGTLMLVIRRLADGSTSAQWFAQIKRDGRRTKRAIGRFPDMTLATARQYMAAEVSPALLAGKALRVAHNGEKPTVEALFRGYVASLNADGADSAVEVERVLLNSKRVESAADALGRTRLASEVEPADVADYVASYLRRGVKGAGDKARSYIQSAYNWGIKSQHDPRVDNRRSWGIDKNPAADVPRDPDAIRTIERNLTPDELRRLWLAADGTKHFSAEVAGIIRLMIGTGQRVQETIRMDGCEIDLADASWNMPKPKTKMKLRDHSVPLPRQVLPMLAELKAENGDGPLFPARDEEGGRIQARSVRQAITRWLASKDGRGIPHFTPRDIRRTWKSRMLELDTSETIVDAIQQHARTGTARKNYDRANYMPKFRNEMAKWEAWLDELLGEQLQRDDAA